LYREEASNGHNLHVVSQGRELIALQYANCLLQEAMTMTAIVFFNLYPDERVTTTTFFYIALQGSKQIQQKFEHRTRCKGELQRYDDHATIKRYMLYCKKQ
jgi:hypothetical protein